MTNNGGPHTNLAKFVRDKYYPKADLSKIESMMLADKVKFDKALEGLYNAKNKDKGTLDQFRTAYFNKFGDPFSKKKDGGKESSTENAAVQTADAPTNLTYSWGPTKKEELAGGEYAVSQESPTDTSKFTKEQKADRRKAVQENIDRTAYDDLMRRRNGDLSLTGDQVNPPEGYKKEELSKKKTIAERAMWNKYQASSDDGTTTYTKDGEEKTVPEQKTFTDYEYHIGKIQQDIKDLNGAIPHIDRQIKSKYGGDVWDRVNKLADNLKWYEGKQLTQEEADAANKIQEELKSIQEDPMVVDYLAAVDLYNRNIEKAKEYATRDDYQFVRDLMDHYKTNQTAEDIKANMLGVGPNYFGNTSELLLKMMGKTVAKVGSSAGAVMDWAEALTTGDDKYNWFDELTDTLVDLPVEMERTFPNPSKWSRPLRTETVKKDGLEYDIKNNQIQAVRAPDGTIIDKKLSEKEQEEILSEKPEVQWNSSGLIYKGAQMGLDLTAMVLMTRGVGQALGGSKLAFQAGVTASTMGQMTGDLYRQGLEDFNGDKKKAGLYALGTSFAIGAASNISGVEAKLAGGQTSILGEGAIQAIKNPVAKKIAMAMSAGTGEMFEETIQETVLDALIKTSLGGTPDDIDWGEMAETAILSFAMGALSGAASSSTPNLNEMDNAAITTLIENPDKAADVIDQQGENEKLIERIKKTSGKMNSIEVPEGVDAEDIAGAMFEHTVAEENLEKAKKSKIQPLIDARQEDMNRADEKVAEILQLKMEKPETGYKPEPMVKKPLPKKPFEPQTKEDHIADWFASGGRIGLEDYKNSADINELTNETGSVSVNYYSNYINKDKGTDNLDTLAQTMSEETGMDISVNDITNFIKESKGPKTHMKEAQNLRAKAEAYNMSEAEYQEYESTRGKIIDKYIGDVEATDQAIEAAGDVLMNNQQDGKVDMGQIEVEGLEPEVKTILTDAINKAKDQALSYEQQKLQETETAIVTPEEMVNTETVQEEVTQEPVQSTVEEANQQKEIPEVDIDEASKNDTPARVKLAGVDIGIVPRKRLNRFLKKVVDNLFKSWGQLPKEVFKENVKRKGRINAKMKRVAFDNLDLQKAIQKTGPLEKKGKLDKAKLSDANMAILGDILHSDKEMLTASDTQWEDGSQISLDVLEVLARMRDNIDALSIELKNAGIGGDELAVIIDNNLNTYVHRSYRVHTDPKWIDKVEELDQFRAAATWVVDEAVATIGELEAKKTEKLVELETATQEEAEQLNQDIENIDIRIEQNKNVIKDPEAHVRSLLKEQANNSLEKVASGAKVGSKEFGILRKRKEVPPVLRDLFGEYVDPLTSYAHSVFKMSHLLENHKFLERIKEWGMGKVFFNSPTGKYDDKIASQNDHFMSPLASKDNPIYTSTEIKQAMETFDKPGPTPVWFKALLAGSIATKYGKTILSPATQIRNFLQNFAFHWNNGHWFKATNPRIWMTGVNNAWAAMDNWAKGNEEARSEYMRMVELGIFDENSTYGEMRSLLNDFFNDSGIYNPDDPFVKRTRKKIGSKAEGLYAFGDDAHKYMAYIMERERYAPALKGKKYSELDDAEKQEIDEYVADIIRDTYQTYSMISPYVKEFRKAPFTGSFISFTYEVYRNTKNNIKIGIKEMKQGVKENNPKLRNIGMSRIAGTTSMYMAFAAIGKYLTSFFDLGEDDDVRWVLPPWDEESLVIPVHRDGNNIYVISTASTIPQGGIYSIMEAALDERKDAAGRVDKVFDQAKDDFIAWDIFTQHLIEAGKGEKFTGQEIHGKDDPDKMLKKLDHMYRAIEPGAFRSTARVVKSFVDPERDYDKLNPAVELLSIFGGVRVVSINLDRAIKFPAMKLGDRRNSALGIYRDRARVDKYKKLNVADRQKELSDELRRAKTAYKKVYMDAIEFSKAMRRMGVDRKTVEESLKNGGWSKIESRKIMSGVEHIPLRDE